eukprot:PhM_4_TR13977/c4_g9_i1/m.15619
MCRHQAALSMSGCRGALACRPVLVGRGTMILVVVDRARDAHGHRAAVRTDEGAAESGVQRRLLLRDRHRGHHLQVREVRDGRRRRRLVQLVPKQPDAVALARREVGGAVERPPYPGNGRAVRRVRVDRAGCLRVDLRGRVAGVRRLVVLRHHEHRSATPTSLHSKGRWQRHQRVPSSGITVVIQRGEHTGGVVSAAGGGHVLLVLEDKPVRRQRVRHWHTATNREPSAQVRKATRRRRAVVVGHDHLRRQHDEAVAAVVVPHLAAGLVGVRVDLRHDVGLFLVERRVAQALEGVKRAAHGGVVQRRRYKIFRIVAVGGKVTLFLDERNDRGRLAVCRLLFRRGALRFYGGGADRGAGGMAHVVGRRRGRRPRGHYLVRLGLRQHRCARGACGGHYGVVAVAVVVAGAVVRVPTAALSRALPPSDRVEGFVAGTNLFDDGGR